MNYTEVHAFIDKVKKQDIKLNCIIACIAEYGTSEEYDALTHLIKRGLECYSQKEERDEELYQNTMAGNF